MMENIDELLSGAALDDYGPSQLIFLLRVAIRAQQAEIERLKGEYARGITDCETVIDKEFERTGNIMNIIKAVSALLQKQKEGE